MTIEFKPWGKTPRLFREIVITEKIDGTNACVVIQPSSWDDPHQVFEYIMRDGIEYAVAAQSRNRLITPENDNAGFARWVRDNAYELVKTLGVGYHYGEWWGRGIQRGYELYDKRFSLFNTSRWKDEDVILAGVHGLDVVPELYRGTFDEGAIQDALARLRDFGSVAAGQVGSMGQKAEGVIVYHSQSKQVYKVLLENDAISKTEAKAA